MLEIVSLIFIKRNKKNLNILAKSCYLPSKPFPEVGRLILKFNLERGADGLEHAATGSQILH